MIYHFGRPWRRVSVKIEPEWPVIGKQGNSILVSNAEGGLYICDLTGFLLWAKRKKFDGPFAARLELDTATPTLVIDMAVWETEPDPWHYKATRRTGDIEALSVELAKVEAEALPVTIREQIAKMGEGD